MRCLWIFMCLGCGETGQARVKYPAVAAGAPGVFTVGDWQVTLEVARAAFGPAYFCATESASMDLCPTAVNELALVASFDALDAQAQPLGDVQGITGTLRSVEYDLGITWFTRQNAATPATFDGHSAHFEGRAENNGAGFRFVADLDLPPTRAGTLAVQGARVDATVRDSRLRLTIAVDPRRWWDDVDYHDLALQPGDPIVVAPDSRAYNSVALRMTTLAAPTFTWSQQP